MTTPTPEQPPVKRSSRHKWFIACLLLVLLLPVMLILSLPYSLPHILASHDIELKIEQPAWQLNGLSAQQISLDYQGQQLVLDGFNLGWNWFSPSLELLQIDKISAKIRQLPSDTSTDTNSNQPAATATPASEFNLTGLQQLPAWLPRLIEIRQLQLDLNAVGSFSGHLIADFGPQRNLRQPQQFELQLKLQQLAEPHQQLLAQYQPTSLELQLSLNEQNSNNPALQLQLSLDGKLQLELQALLALQLQPAIALINNASLRIQLDSWQLDDLQAMASSFIIDNASFEIHLDDLENSLVQLPLHGKIKALSHPQLYAQDWQLQGMVDGNLKQLLVDMRLEGDKGIKLHSKSHWHNQQLDASIELLATNLKNNNPLARSLKNWPQTYQLHQGEYSAKADFHYANQRASGNVSINTNNLVASLQEQQLNNLNLRLSAEASLHLPSEQEQWLLQFNNTGVGFVLDSFQLDRNTKFEDLAGALILQGEINPQHLDLKLSHSAYVSSQKNRLYKDLGSQKITANLHRLSFNGDYQQPERLNFDIEFAAEINALQSLQLKPQQWNLNSQLSGNLNNWRNHSRLSSQHGFQLDNHLQGNQNSLKLRSQLAQIDFSHGNPLEKTLHKWPELLHLTSGTVNNLLTLDYHQNKPLKLDFNSSLSHINGVYNSSELSAANLELNAMVRGDDLQAILSKFTISAINPGIPLNAISINGANYHASLQQPLAGTLNWQSIYAQLLNGNIYSGEHSIRLDQDSPVLVEIDNLELQELMQAYPTDGLEGNGVIDGKIPLIVSLDGVRVDHGHLAARQPGLLRFRSDELSQMARSNPGLQILNQALDDFHFKVLTSDLSFEKDGKLTLAMRLEGSNPNFEKGRPIHFNFNLEQNLFALLASIQLTNQVNDLILQRLRQRALTQ